MNTMTQDDEYSASERLEYEMESEMTDSAMPALDAPARIMPGKKLRVQTFGNFEVFADGTPLTFKRSKTKELFAYLVMRRGARCSNREVAAVIWEDRTDTPALQSHYRLLVSDLKKSLKAVCSEDVLIKQRGYLAVAPENFSCDMYEYCVADVNAIKSYTGEFMAQYSWAELTNSYLDRIR